MKPTTIDLEDVAVTTDAVRAWQETCRAALRLLPAGVAAEDVPDEQAEVLPSGRLRVFVPHPTMRRRVLAAMVVPPEHWTWRS